MKLMTMLRFVGWVRGMTTKEKFDTFPNQFTRPTLEAGAEGLLLFDAQIWMLVQSYRKFLVMKPTLGMFVPCDDKGNPIEKPEKFITLNVKPTNNATTKLEKNLFNWSIRCYEYTKALDRIWFEGFTFEESDFVDGWCGYLYLNKKHVMSLLLEDDEVLFEIEEEESAAILEELSHLDLTLTPNAIKHILR